MDFKKALYRVEEVAELLSYSKATIYAMVEDGTFRCKSRFPGKSGMRIYRESIIEYLAHDDSFQSQ